jgi:hypothetical protein
MSLIPRHTVVYGILKYIKNVVQVESHMQMKPVMMPLLMQAVAVHPASAENSAWAPAKIMSGKSLGFQARAAHVRDPGTHKIFSDP